MTAATSNNQAQAGGSPSSDSPADAGLRAADLHIAAMFGGRHRDHHRDRNDGRVGVPQYVSGIHRSGSGYVEGAKNQDSNPYRISVNSLLAAV
jgi:hypothetical protein